MNIRQQLWAITLITAHLMSTVTCLWCYQCRSTKSWLDCDNNLYKAQCDPLHNVCTSYIRKSFEHDNTVYTRMCGTDENCSADECKYRNLDCDVYCCNKDFCNVHGTASTHATSGVIIIVCLIIQFIMNILENEI